MEFLKRLWDRGVDMKARHPIALFRLSVLDPLISKEHFERGELKLIISELATYYYDIPNSKRTQLTAKTIESWYYLWKHGGSDALEPKTRSDSSQSKIPKILQEKIISLKKENPQLSIDSIKDRIQKQCIVGAQTTSRSSIYRLLSQKGISSSRKPTEIIERRKFKPSSASKCYCDRLRISFNENEIWLRKLLQGKLQLDDLTKDFYNLIPQEDIKVLYDCILKKPLRYRNRAVCILALSKRISRKIISDYLFISPSTIEHSFKLYKSGGVQAVISDHQNITPKHKQQEYIDKLFSILHSPPSSYGFNRITWRLKDLKTTMDESGMGINKYGIERIIKDAGYSYKKARTVLTSNDPDYKEKLTEITKILSHLKKNEKFFSIDEYGPFSIKMQGGKSLVPSGTYKSVPQWQKSKGSLILTAALELSTNQVIHFYSEKKNTDEMIKLLNIIIKEYPEEKTIYFSWDAASWHASKALYKVVDEINSVEYRKKHKTPKIILVPLPTCAQFLNIIESVFSGMARAIIHNSNYQSVDECKEAINRYYDDRNKYFLENHKKAGNKIWGKERVKVSFSESNNCKDPKYR